MSTLDRHRRPDNDNAAGPPPVLDGLRLPMPAAPSQRATVAAQRATATMLVRNMVNLIGPAAAATVLDEQLRRLRFGQY